MSADVTLFHSSEADAPIAEGWYIGTYQGDTLTTDDAVGPFSTHAEAAQALARGDWLKATPCYNASGALVGWTDKVQS